MGIAVVVRATGAGMRSPDGPGHGRAVAEEPGDSFSGSLYKQQFSRTLKKSSFFPLLTKFTGTQL